MSFDIETMTLMTTPKDLKYDRTAAVIQIGAVTLNTITGKREHHIFTHKDCAEVPDTVVHSFKTEKELIIGFDKHIHDIQPDFLIGYNIYKFDMAYLVVRAEYLDDKANQTLFTPNRFYKYRPNLTRIENSKIETNAYGTMEYYYVPTHGIVQIDLYPYIRREYKLGSYTLNSVSEYFLKDKKDDIDHHQIHDYFNSGTPELIAVIAKYCVQDCRLVLNLCLFKKLSVIINLIEMANVTCVPIQWLLRRGQQIKVYSQICKYAKKYGYLIPDSSCFRHKETDDDDLLDVEEAEGRGPSGRELKDTKDDNDNDNDNENDEEEMVEDIEYEKEKQKKIEKLETKISEIKNKLSKLQYEKDITDLTKDLKKRENDLFTIKNKYQGATVLTAIVGPYLTNPVINLDFASLYPSIMIANKLCYTTIVNDDKYLNLPNVNYVKHNKWTFAHAVNENEHTPVLPTVLTNLLSERREVKKQMKNASGFEKDMLNAKQNALKLVCNSVYGFCGAYRGGMMSCIPIANTVTNIGRKMIQKAKTVAEEFIGIKNGRVIYGDTDSLYIEIFCPKNITETKDKIEYAAQIGVKLSFEINKQFPKPIEMVFDNVMYPMLLMSKKRYVGIKYEVSGSVVNFHEEFYEKGLVGTRRNYCLMFKKIYKEAINTLIYQRDTKLVVDNLMTTIKKILDGSYIDINDFIMTSSLQGSFKKENLAQAVVAHKIEEREPGKGPKKGDRVRFVYTITPMTRNFTMKKTSNESGAEKAEDPDYVIKNNVPLDYVWYIEHQIQPQMTTLLSLFIRKEIIDSLFTDILCEAKLKRESMQSKDGFNKLFKI